MGQTFTVDGLKNAMIPIEPGVYTVRLSKIAPKTSKAGNVYLAAQFTIEDAEDGDLTFAGRKLFHNFNTTHEVGVQVYARFLKAADVSPEGDSVDLDDLDGATCVVTVTQDYDDRGELRAEIRSFASCG